MSMFHFLVKAPDGISFRGHMVSLHLDSHYITDGTSGKYFHLFIRSIISCTGTVNFQQMMSKNGISKSLNRAAVMSPKLGDERHRTMCFLFISSVHSFSLSVPHFLITLQLDRAAIPAAQLSWLSTPRAHSSSYSLFDVFCRNQHTPWVQESVDWVPWSVFCHLFCDKFMGPKQ